MTTTPPSTLEQQIAECPFHAKGVCEVSVLQPRGQFYMWQVVSDCGALGPYGETRSVAIDHWNRRHTQKGEDRD